MSDTFSPAARAAVMRAVKSTDTAPERLVRRIVRELGFGYRLHAKDLPGKPDLVFRGRRKVIFVHGCFWHGHECARGARQPKANAAYWRAKIAANRARDQRTLAALSAAGWSAFMAWECETRDKAGLAVRLGAFLDGD
jgi:DNA mismatch endonuclease, patch repair protein